MLAAVCDGHRVDVCMPAAGVMEACASKFMAVHVHGQMGGCELGSALCLAMLSKHAFVEGVPGALLWTAVILGGGECNAPTLVTASCHVLHMCVGTCLIYTALLLCSAQHKKVHQLTPILIESHLDCDSWLHTKSLSGMLSRLRCGTPTRMPSSSCSRRARGALATCSMSLQMSQKRSCTPFL